VLLFCHLFGFSQIIFYMWEREKSLLQIGTVAMDKPLWVQVTDSSLLLHLCSDSTVMMGRSRPSQLWSVAAMGTMTSGIRRYYVM
jgi:hypothetical protein